MISKATRDELPLYLLWIILLHSSIRLGDRQNTDLFIVSPVMLKCDIGVHEKKLEEIGIFYRSYYFCIKLKLQATLFSQSTFYQNQYASIVVVVRFFLN